MPGSLPSNYLDVLAFGVQASAGAAMSAESEDTIGPSRLDTRVPPSLYHLSLLQVSRLKEFAQAISGHLKGGSRLRMYPVSASPFGATEHGLWSLYAASGPQHPKWSTGNVAYQLLYQYWPRTRVTGATHTVVDTDHIIEVDRAGAVTVTLPAHSSGRNILIVDTSGAASSNNITINRAGSDTINGATSKTISTDYGYVWIHGGASGEWNVIGETGGGGGSGDIEGVTAGDGLTGGGTSGSVSLAVGAGTGISVSADAVGISSLAFFSPAKIAEAKGDALVAGNFTVGVKFALLSAGTVTGARFWYPGGASKTIKVGLWNASSALEQTVDVAVSAAGYYTATFPGSESVPAFATWAVSVYDQAGSHIWRATYDANLPQPAQLGPHIIYATHSSQRPVAYSVAAGDAYPTTGASGFVAPVEPIFTVP